MTVCERPDVSVVIPTFRRSDGLRRALDSCMAQETPGASFEVVVVDNCPDRSAIDVARRARQRASMPIRYVHEARAGVSHARNRGVQESRGRFIAFLDDDETAGWNWLESLVTEQQETGADVVHGAVVAVLPPGTTRHIKLIADYFTRLPVPGPEGEAHRNGIGNCLLSKESCFSEPEPFDRRMGRIGGEDSLFFRHLARRNVRFASSAKAVVYEHLTPERASLRYVLERKFRTSQIHTLVTMRQSPPAPGETARWMAVGAGQLLVFAPFAALAWLVRSKSWPNPAMKAIGGLGKLCWMQSLIREAYGDETVPTPVPPPAPADAVGMPSGPERL